MCAVGEEKLVPAFGSPPPFKNGSAIAGSNLIPVFVTVTHCNQELFRDLFFALPDFLNLL